jgi:multidrug efflux pump subunit AcrA (membrane-fusion protein)
MRVKFTLPEQYIGKVTRGAEIGVTAAGEKDRRAKIVQVSPVVDPASGTIEVVAELLGPAGELRPGMTAQVTLPKP